MRCLDLDSGAECGLVAHAAVALGNFDGVHIGHRAIFDELGRDLVRAVFTFADLRRSELLCSLGERLSLIAGCGVRYALVVNFAEVRDLSPESFCDMMCNEFRVLRFVCGYNFTFGAHARATANDLRRLAADRGIETYVVDPVTLGGEPVSSTRVREMLRAGDTAGVSAALGRRWGFTQPVIAGRALGRTMGFPTVNQVLPAELAAPRRGVYASRCYVDGRELRGVTNIGVRPTFADADGGALVAETHIFDFEGDLYGRTLRVELCDFIRDERRFASSDDLAAQIAKDANDARGT